MSRLLLLFSTCCLGLHGAELKVVTLHPLLADMARQVGEDRVEVIEWVGANDNPHHFEPTPENLRRAGELDLCIASGKGMETYLPSLKTILPESAKLVELGAALPSLDGSCDNPDHHHAGPVDPHWWHSIDAFRRATTVLAGHFAAADPDGASHYQQRALDYRRRLDKLERWTRRELARIPSHHRTLATAHNAFGYLAHDFDFETLPVQGLNREQMPDARSLAGLISQLRASGVPAIFPEKSSNPKVLEALTSDIGIRLAAPLIADGTTAKTYEEMMRHNIETIVEGLAGKAAEKSVP